MKNKREIIKKIVKGLFEEVGFKENKFIVNLYLNGCSDEKIERIYKIIEDNFKK